MYEDQPVKRLTVNVPEHLHRQLKVHATSQGKQMSEIMLGLVNQYIRENTVSKKENLDG